MSDRDCCHRFAEITPANSSLDFIPVQASPTRLPLLVVVCLFEPVAHAQRASDILSKAVAQFDICFAPS